jgi:hypothetical protein
MVHSDGIQSFVFHYRYLVASDPNSPTVLLASAMTVDLYTRHPPLVMIAQALSPDLCCVDSPRKAPTLAFVEVQRLAQMLVDRRGIDGSCRQEAVSLTVVSLSCLRGCLQQKGKAVFERDSISHDQIKITEEERKLLGQQSKSERDVEKIASYTIVPA